MGYRQVNPATISKFTELSGFVELDELIIFGTKCFDVRLCFHRDLGQIEECLLIHFAPKNNAFHS